MAAVWKSAFCVLTRHHPELQSVFMKKLPIRDSVEELDSTAYSLDLTLFNTFGINRDAGCEPSLASLMLGVDEDVFVNAGRKVLSGMLLWQNHVANASCLTMKRRTNAQVCA